MKSTMKSNGGSSSPGAYASVGAALQRGGALGLGEVQGPDLCVAEQPQVPQGVLAEASRSDHQRPAPAARAAQRLETLGHGPVGGETATGQRGAEDGIQVAERRQVGGVGNQHLLGVPAVGEDARLPRVDADHLHALIAEFAGPASPRCVDHDRAQPRVHTGHLVAEDQRQRAGDHSFHHVQVGVANAARGDLNDLVRRIGLGVVADEVELRVERLENDGSHLTAPA